jgi:putative hemolysin
MPPVCQPNPLADKSVQQMNKTELTELANLLSFKIPVGHTVLQICNLLKPVVAAQHADGFGHANFARILPLPVRKDSPGGLFDNSKEWGGTTGLQPAGHCTAHPAQSFCAQQGWQAAAVPRACHGSGGILDGLCK